MSASRPPQQELFFLTAAKELIRYTFTVTDNQRNFPKKTRFTLVNRLQEKALTIYELLLEANEIYPTNPQEKRERQRLQSKALTLITELLFLVELSKEKGYIDSHKCEVWTKHALDVKYPAAAWMKKDKERF